MSRSFVSTRRSGRARVPSARAAAADDGHTSGTRARGDDGGPVVSVLDFWRRVRYDSQWTTLKQISGRVARPFGNVVYILAAFVSGKPDQPFFYIGESSNAVRRLLQHWGVLPGGARETKPYNTELFTVCTVSGFCPRKGRTAAAQRKYLALYLEYVLQHKSGDARLLEHVDNAHVNGRLRVPSFQAVVDFMASIGRQDRIIRRMCWLHLATCHPLFAPAPLHIAFHVLEFQAMYTMAVDLCRGFVWDRHNAWVSGANLGLTRPARKAESVYVENVVGHGGGMHAAPAASPAAPAASPAAPAAPPAAPAASPAASHGTGVAGTSGRRGRHRVRAGDWEI